MIAEVKFANKVMDCDKYMIVLFYWIVYNIFLSHCFYTYTNVANIICTFGGGGGEGMGVWEIQNGEMLNFARYCWYNSEACIDTLCTDYMMRSWVKLMKMQHGKHLN
jgi:hypothetical protein